VLVVVHHLHHTREQLEVVRLRSKKWMFFEEWDDSRPQRGSVLDAEAQEPNSVRGGSVLLDDTSASEEAGENFNRVSRGRGLNDRKLVLNLPAEPARRILNDRYREAAFPVDKADDPLLETRSFLLIVRTGWIVTAHTSHPTNWV
jgi:hypothetical protein